MIKRKGTLSVPTEKSRYETNLWQFSTPQAVTGWPVTRLVGRQPAEHEPQTYVDQYGKNERLDVCLTSTECSGGVMSAVTMTASEKCPVIHTAQPTTCSLIQQTTSVTRVL